MSKLPHALADIRAEFDEKSRVIEELTEKLRLQVAENSELKRQFDKVYAQLAEHTSGRTAAASGPIKASDNYSKPPSRRDKLSTDALSDVLPFLSRFNIDAAQMTRRQWRYVVEKMLTMQCLREIDYVTLKRRKKPSMDQNNGKARYGNHVFENSGWGDYESDEPLEDADCIFVVSFGRYGEAAAPLGGIAQENMRRGLVFESCEAASDYLLRLIRSATIDDFRLKSLVLTEHFFKGLLTIAATVRAKKLILSGCSLDGVDAGSLQDALLQFQSVSELAVGHRLLPGHISDGLLTSAGGKLALTQLHYETNGPIGAEKARFDATDYGVMQFLFQPTKKQVTLQISHVNVSPMFCSAIFKKALSEPAANDLVLSMRFRNLEQDRTGILNWRLSGDHSQDVKEVYTAVDALGKRLRLSVGLESLDGAVSSIEFRRSEQCPCKGNVDGHAVGHCNTRRIGGFANDVW